MLSIKNNEIEMDDTNIFKLMVEYTSLSGAVYSSLVKEFGKEKAKDFMLNRLIKMVSEVENTEE